jgi:hypothetical protein
MFDSPTIILGGLVGLNIALYAPLVFAAVQRRRRRVAATNLVEAFNGLELALKNAVPDLPAGFTWEEAVDRLKASGVWTVEMEDALKGYEAYRYGGAPLPDIDFRAVVEVANLIGKGAATQAATTSARTSQPQASATTNNGGTTNIGR